MGSLHSTRRRAAAAVGVLGLITAGCGTYPTQHASTPSETSGGEVFSESFAKERTVRIRAVSCEGVATGSGFVYDDHTIVTNRHVVDGAYKVAVETWDGRTLEPTLSRQAYFADLGIIELEEPVSDEAPVSIGEPQVGEGVHTSGYPEGGRWTSTSGKVTGIRHDAELGTTGLIVLTDAPVLPGNSGGPLFNDAGELIGVTYAEETESGESLAVAASTLKSMVESDGEFRSVRSC